MLDYLTLLLMQFYFDSCTCTCMYICTILTSKILWEGGEREVGGGFPRAAPSLYESLIVIV